MNREQKRKVEKEGTDTESFEFRRQQAAQEINAVMKKYRVLLVPGVAPTLDIQEMPEEKSPLVK